MNALVNDAAIAVAERTFSSLIGQQQSWQFALEKALIAATDYIACERECGCEYHDCTRLTVGLGGERCVPCEVGAHEDQPIPDTI